MNDEKQNDDCDDDGCHFLVSSTVNSKIEKIASVPAACVTWIESIESIFDVWCLVRGEQEGGRTPPRRVEDGRRDEILSTAWTGYSSPTAHIIIYYFAHFGCADIHSILSIVITINHHRTHLSIALSSTIIISNRDELGVSRAKSRKEEHAFDLLFEEGSLSLSWVLIAHDATLALDC